MSRRYKTPEDLCLYVSRVSAEIKELRNQIFAKTTDREIYIDQMNSEISVLTKQWDKCRSDIGDCFSEYDLDTLETFSAQVNALELEAIELHKQRVAKEKEKDAYVKQINKEIYELSENEDRLLKDIGGAMQVYKMEVKESIGLQYHSEF